MLDRDSIKHAARHNIFAVIESWLIFCSGFKNLMSILFITVYGAYPYKVINTVTSAAKIVTILDLRGRNVTFLYLYRVYILF